MGISSNMFDRIMDNQLTKTQIVRSIVMTPALPLVIFVGILLDDMTGILEYYYPYYKFLYK